MGSIESIKRAIQLIITGATLKERDLRMVLTLQGLASYSALASEDANRKEWQERVVPIVILTAELLGGELRTRKDDPEELAAQLTNRMMDEVTGKSFEELLDELGELARKTAKERLAILEIKDGNSRTLWLIRTGLEREELEARLKEIKGWKDHDELLKIAEERGILRRENCRVMRISLG